MLAQYFGDAVVVVLRFAVASHWISLTRVFHIYYFISLFIALPTHTHMLRSYLCTQQHTTLLLFCFFSLQFNRWLSGWIFGFLGDQLLYFGRLVLVWFGLARYNLTQPLYYYRNSCKVSQMDRIPYNKQWTAKQEDAIFYTRGETWPFFFFFFARAS